MMNLTFAVNIETKKSSTRPILRYFSGDDLEMIEMNFHIPVDSEMKTWTKHDLA